MEDAPELLAFSGICRTKQKQSKKGSITKNVNTLLPERIKRLKNEKVNLTEMLPRLTRD